MADTGLLVEEVSSDVIMEKCRSMMDEVLIGCRQLRDRKPLTGSRELAEAITCFETGCMWMIRSNFAEAPYSPLTRLKKAE